MKLSLFILLLISVVVIKRSEQQEARSCVFVNCSCGEEEEEQPESSEDGSSQVAPLTPYELVNCDKLKEFPPRDSSRRYSNSIATLELNAHDFQYIPEDRFTDLEIGLLDLSVNKLTSLSANVFRGIKKLELLDLSKNQLNDLDAEVFTPVQGTLMQLKLSQNDLSQMEPSKLSSVLSNIANLKSLFLRHNRLTSVPNISNLNKLEELSLDSNQIESLVDPDTNEQLIPSSLIDLSLENNRIKQITDKTFENLKNLKFLNLASNQIASISENAFNHLTKLTTLTLKKNHLNHIPSGIFYGLVSLERLDLSSQNQILKQIDNYAFDRSSNMNILRKIDLSNNRISSIDNKAFCSKNHTYPYVNIKEIDLAANQLTGVNSCIIRQLSKGFNDFKQAKQYVVPSPGRPKISFKLVSSQLTETITSVLKCDCEITKAASLIDFEGDCENSEGVMVPLKKYICSTESSLTAEDIEDQCAKMSEYDCSQQDKNTDENTDSKENKDSNTNESTTQIKDENKDNTDDNSGTNSGNDSNNSGNNESNNKENNNNKVDNVKNEEKNEKEKNVVTKAPSSVISSADKLFKLNNLLFTGLATILLSIFATS